jgi:hypothetical protein
VQLTDYEKARRDEILVAQNYDALSDLEETCDGSKSYHYEIHPSNIGDSIFLVFKGEKYFLSDPDSF